MQLLSCGWLLGAVAVQPGSSSFSAFKQMPEIQRYWPFLVGSLVVGVIIAIVCDWVASKVMARKETATFGNAVVWWLCTIAFLILFAVVLGILVPVLGKVTETWRVISALCGVLLLSFVIAVSIPMKIYGIGFWRAIGLILLAIIFQAVVNFGLGFAVEPLLMKSKDYAALREAGEVSSAELRSKLDELSGADPSTEINRLLDEATHLPLQPLPKREASVRRLQDKLEKRRKMLPPGDAAAATMFRIQLDRYLRLLNEVKAERAASSAREASYFPAENFTSLVT